MNRNTSSETSGGSARLLFVLSMIIFGTIGLFRRSLPLPSTLIAFARALIGTIFLLLFLAIRKMPISFSSIRKNLLPIIGSGILLGFNWILLFEAYEYTSVAVATLCYYMAPIFVLLVSPFLLKEALTLKKTICILLALLGMVLVSGVLQESISVRETKGILLGLAAAVLYASIILMNKKIKDVSAFDKTVVQLAISAIVMLPYMLLTVPFGDMVFTASGIGLLLIMGIVHTGVAYALYFGSMGMIKAQTAALMSYIDPIVALLLSALLLREPMSLPEIIGAVLVLGATIASES